VSEVRLTSVVAVDASTVLVSGIGPGTQSTDPIAWNTPTADFQAALEKLASIGAGNVAVALTAPGVYTVTFRNQLGKRALPKFGTSSNATLIGGPTRRTTPSRR
jgi:hypothetical protein